MQVCYYFQERLSRRARTEEDARCAKVRGGEDEAPLLWLLDGNRVRDTVVYGVYHVNYQMTEVVLCWSWGINDAPTPHHAPERTHLHHRAWPRGEWPAKRWLSSKNRYTGRAGLEGDDTSFPPSSGLSHCTLQLQSPTSMRRVPGAVPPNRAGAGITLHLQANGWMDEATSRSSSSHCELSLRLQKHRATPGQVLGSCDIVYRRIAANRLPPYLI